MRFRKSKCVPLFVVLVAFHLVVLTIIRSGFNSNYLLTKFHQLNYDFASMSFLFKPKDAYSFNKWIDKLYANMVALAATNDNKMLLFAVQPSTKLVPDTVTLPKYLKGNSENPHVSPFDPRFTLGIYLNHLNNQLQENNGNLQDLVIDNFHWSDWTNLSDLYLRLFSSPEVRPRCPDLLTTQIGRTVKKEVFDPTTYCYNDDELAEIISNPATSDDLKATLNHLRQDPLRLGFHVHSHPGRASIEKMALCGASFLNDFMPAPLSVLFLIPSGAHQFLSLNVPVNQEILSRIRLVDSPIASGVAQRQNTVAVSHEVKKVAKIAKTDEKPMFSPTRDLVKEDFCDPLVKLLSEHVPDMNVSPHEKLYFDSLEASVNTERVPKYFDEAKLVRVTPNWGMGGHYDWRFFKKLYNSSDLQLTILHGLLLAWLRFTAANNLTTWIAHGSLLSWYWDGMVFPWDSDIDVQMPVADLHRLARNFNQTVVVDFGPDQDQVRYGRYLIDCGTWISHRQIENGLNFIDARFIDLDLGLYIDVTGLSISNSMAPVRYDKLLPSNLKREQKFARNNDPTAALPQGQVVRVPDENEVERNTLLNLFNCRNSHFVSLEEICPLKLTYMEGVPAYVPNQFTRILQDEYGNQSMKNKKHRQSAFFPRLRLWHDFREVRSFLMKSKGKELELGSDTDFATQITETVAVSTISDTEYILYLSLNWPMLTEYVLTRNVTSLHEQEMDLLLQGKPTEELLFEKEGLLKHEFMLIRHDFTSFDHCEHDFNFDKEVEGLESKYSEFKSRKSQRPEEGD